MRKHHAHEIPSLYLRAGGADPQLSAVAPLCVPSWPG